MKTHIPLYVLIHSHHGTVTGRRVKVHMKTPTCGEIASLPTDKLSHEHKIRFLSICLYDHHHDACPELKPLRWKFIESTIYTAFMFAAPPLPLRSLPSTSTSANIHLIDYSSGVLHVSASTFCRILFGTSTWSLKSVWNSARKSLLSSTA